MLRKVPLIVILGSTGTGKTKLSIELARKFNGEVISADSMQVYADLDIVTAKATKDEQDAVKHHLLDVVKPSSEPFTVKHFRNLALPIIDDLLETSKCPIVVGGTNYYIESLLWDILVDPQLSPSKSQLNAPPLEDTKKPKRRKRDSSSNENCEDSTRTIARGSRDDEYAANNDNDDDTSQEDSTPSNNSDIAAGYDLELESMSPEELHERLKLVDPISAGRIHPNNKRKILRALEIFYESGKPLSDYIKEQRNRPGGNRLGGPLRYPHIILLWLRCDQNVLNERLDKRVDSMLESGLLPEVRNFYETYIKSENANQFTKGVLQSIGFKEFVPYLEKFGTDQDKIIENYLQNIFYNLPEEPTVSEPEGLDLLRNCLDELKLVTRRYSKRQIKWIKNRFLGSADRQVPALYALNTSNVDRWESNVSKPAVDIIESYINGKSSSIEPMPAVQHPGTGLNEEVLNFCETCKRHFVGEFQWKLHLASNKHKRAKDGARKRQKRLEQGGDQSGDDAS